MKSLLIVSSDDAVEKFKCDTCGNATLVASTNESPHCFHCGDTLEDGTQVKDTALTASAQENANHLTCTSCDETMTVYHSNMSSEDVALTGHCILCGTDTLEETEVDDDSDAELETDQESEDEALEDVEDDMKESLEASSKIDVDSLQWSIVDNKDATEGTLLASSSETGMPLIVFHKKDAPEGMKALFASTGFVDAFSKVAETSSLGDAVKTFGGSFFNSSDVLSSINLEAMAFNKVEATVIPKLISCCQTAVEGGVKGIFPDVSVSVQDFLVNELVASSIPRERAETAVTNAFALHGSNLFGIIIAKACELYNKSDEQLKETQELIASAEGPGFQPYNEEQIITQMALNKPDVVLTPSVGLTAGAHDTNTKDSVLALKNALFS